MSRELPLRLSRFATFGGRDIHRREGRARRETNSVQTPKNGLYVQIVQGYEIKLNFKLTFGESE